MFDLYFRMSNLDFQLYKGDSTKMISTLNQKFDMIFADPPYFLSNDGLTVNSGKIVSVNKGEWDKPVVNVDSFNYEWLKSCREVLKDDGTIWISGTVHNIFSIGQILSKLDFKILNIITWQKTNPPPNFSCRYFTHSTEYIIWARKHEKIPHYFNYKMMKEINDNKQMKDVWTFPAIARWEKSCGKHPTQKPLSVLTRIILASTKPNALILDPFTGSSTTGIAANLLGRNFIGVDSEKEYLNISLKRRKEIENIEVSSIYRSKIKGFKDNATLKNILIQQGVLL